MQIPSLSLLPNIIPPSQLFEPKAPVPPALAKAGAAEPAPKSQPESHLGNAIDVMA